MELFRELEASEIEEFKKWARDNYKPLTPIKGVWHPMVQEECTKMNIGAKVIIDTKLKTEEDS